MTTTRTGKGHTADGGPAFPQFEVVAGERDGHGDILDAYTVARGGMSLRDWFAGQAINGAAYMLGVTEPVTAAMDRRTLCQSAYAIADEMLRARKASEG